MDTPLRLTLRHTQMSAKLGELIEREAEKLSRLHSRISALAVVVEQPNHRRHSGDPCTARVEIDVPGHYIVAHRSHEGATADTAPVAALADAFHSAQQLLRRHVKRSHAHKHAPAHGLGGAQP